MKDDALQRLKKELEGELYLDDTLRTLYSTDASAYREMPLAVAIPTSTKDLECIIRFANEEKIALIPRTAGTSLAGQVVGSGIVVDVSKHFNKIININEKEQTVVVEPGVVRDELNYHLKSHGLFFGPETSTANRAMIGGMVGNNSCGANSIVYGSTRDHLLEVTGYLSDGSFVTFKRNSKAEFHDKMSKANHTMEGFLYKKIYDLLKAPEVQEEIVKEFPKTSIERRNTGYAVDLLISKEPFKEGIPFSFTDLIAGSEGTLMLITSVKLSLDPLPPTNRALVCVHFDDLYESLKANKEVLQFEPLAVELMDHFVLECTKTNVEQSKNRFFVKGDPQAILVIDLGAPTEEALDKKVADLIDFLKKENFGYHYPVVKGADQKKVWSLRKAGLGLLSNIPGDGKAVPVIEDTAVDVADLHDYIKDFNKILVEHDLSCVHYAHAGSGELHLRPIINLKTAEGNALFYEIADRIATLVKKYNGSLSGEHGDGRLRGEFIPKMIGEKNYQLLKEVKAIWDPNNIFNPGKIVDSPSMREHLRYTPGQDTPRVDTLFSFKKEQGMLRAAELCNGSGDCRKLPLSGGTMCPSYMATRNEKETTRARANILREAITNAQPGENPFLDERVAEVLDLCLSCKGCKVECPSNVDMARLKGEAYYQKYKVNGVPFRVRLISFFTKSYEMGSYVPSLFNFFIENKLFSGMLKRVAGFAKERSLPKVAKTTFKRYAKKNPSMNTAGQNGYKGIVYLYADEFIDLNDAHVGYRAWDLLEKLGYAIKLAPIGESGRTYLSKGMLKHAKKIAENNIEKLAAVLKEGDVVVGMEPSTILSFRDEYPDLVREELCEKALSVSRKCLLIEEFIAQEYEKNRIQSAQFMDTNAAVLVHGHCHQKGVASVVPTKKILTIPSNFRVRMIPSGCCGMAGAFGYEKAHYELSMKIGELVLFPTVKQAKAEEIIAASGTSCRHQILDGTGKMALHPIEILFKALKN